MTPSSGPLQLTGLPGPLPEGESILWQGTPCASAFLRHTLPARAALVYLAAAATAVVGSGWANGRSASGIAVSLALTTAAAAIAVGVAWVFARLVARTSCYTITDRRIVMRIGIALPVTFNIPFTILGSAGLRTYEGGAGDIPLALEGSGRIGFIHLWPHARPWRLARPEPMLRCIPDAQSVASIIARAAERKPMREEAGLRAETDLRFERMKEVA